MTTNEDWNLIQRTILSLKWQPGFAPDSGSTFGLGDTRHPGVLSPSKATPGGLIWGAGAITQLPTNTNEVLGNDNWGLARRQ